MPLTEEKYNNKKARYLAALVVQNSCNKNLGVPYGRVIAGNMAIKSSIDFWIEKMKKQ